MFAIQTTRDYLDEATEWDTWEQTFPSQEVAESVGEDWVAEQPTTELFDGFHQLHSFRVVELSN